MMTDEIRESMKLDRQLCFPLYAAARKVTGLYTPYLAPLGLTYTQYIVMMVLWEQERASVGEICRRLMLDNGTVSPLLKKLENAGYISRNRDSVDDRVVTVSLTEEGRLLQEKASAVPSSVGNCIDLAPEKATELYSLLYELLGRNTEND